MVTLMTDIIIGYPLLSLQFMVTVIVKTNVVFHQYFPFLKNTILIQQTVGGVQSIALITVPKFIFPQIARFISDLAFCQKAGRRRH